IVSNVDILGRIGGELDVAKTVIRIEEIVCNDPALIYDLPDPSSGIIEEAGRVVVRPLHARWLIIISKAKARDIAFSVPNLRGVAVLIVAPLHSHTHQIGNGIDPTARINREVCLCQGVLLTDDLELSHHAVSKGGQQVVTVRSVDLDGILSGIIDD